MGQSILGVHGSIFNFLCESSTFGAKLGVVQAVMGSTDSDYEKVPYNIIFRRNFFTKNPI